MKRAVLLSLLLVSSSCLFAQEAEPTPEPARHGLWEAQMPAGKYLVRLSAITSVSMHEYMVDATARITEVTIATSGSEIARFYYIEPNLPQTPGGIGQGTVNALQERGQKALAKVGGEDLWRKVVKNYPTTTHAHTVEYRLETKDSLDKLFASIEQSWSTGRSATFKP